MLHDLVKRSASDDRPSRLSASQKLMAGQLVTTIGNGAFLSSSAIYLTRVVALTPSRVGLVLSVAGITGVLAGVPAGRLSDKIGARTVGAALSLIAGVAVALFGWAGGLIPCILIAALYGTSDRGAYTARQALLVGAFPREELKAVRARLRVVTNVGMGTGALLGAACIAISSPVAYKALFAIDGASYAIFAFVLLGIDVAQRREQPKNIVADKPSRTVFRDGRFLGVSLLNAVLYLHAPLLEVVIPLWLVSRTHAPAAVSASALVMSCIAVVFLQVPIASRIDELGSARRAMPLAAGLLVATCACCVLASQVAGAFAASILLILAFAVNVFAEMVHSSISWVLAFDLPPVGREGEYQGFFNSALSLTQSVAPALLVALVMSDAWHGWAILTAIITVAGTALLGVTRNLTPATKQAPALTG